MSTFPVKKVTLPSKFTAKKPAVTKTSKVTMFRPQVRSRHPSHEPLRTTLDRMPFRSLIRFGSTTEVNDGVRRVVLNEIDAIKKSSNKKLMKTAFTAAGVKSADWYLTTDGKTFIKQGSNDKVKLEELPFPIVAKKLYGSRGEGNYLIETIEDLKGWLPENNLNNLIFEKFYSFNREYRLHVTEDGVFYTNRKMLKRDTPEEFRWYRNDNNSVWIKEENEMFEKPSCWNSIVTESIKALKAIGLDFGAVDVRVQSEKNQKGSKRKDVDFIIIEINSAPSFGEGTLQHYRQIIPQLLNKKVNG